MNNPFKPERSGQHHDNPAVPNAVERPLERAADRAQRHDNPLVPNAIEVPVERAVAGDRPGAVNDTRHIDLFPDEELVGYRSRWDAIQTGFVDQPREAVEQADALVSQVVSRLTEVFKRERSTLEGQWTSGDNVSTEDLRIALTRYRSFFHRLLSM
jgi:hypothetical protein